MFMTEALESGVETTGSTVASPDPIPDLRCFSPRPSPKPSASPIEMIAVVTSTPATQKKRRHFEVGRAVERSPGPARNSSSVGVLTFGGSGILTYGWEPPEDGKRSAMTGEHSEPGAGRESKGGRVFRPAKRHGEIRGRDVSKASPRATARDMFGNEALCTHSRGRGTRAGSCCKRSRDEPCGDVRAHRRERVRSGGSVRGSGDWRGAGALPSNRGDSIGRRTCVVEGHAHAPPSMYSLIASPGQSTSEEAHP